MINLSGHCIPLMLLVNPVELTETHRQASWRKEENPVTFLIGKRMMWHCRTKLSSLARETKLMQVLC